MKDLNFGGTFCVLPWLEEHFTIDGKKSFCCWAKPFEDDDNPEDLRKKIWSNEKITHCEKCYKLESLKIVSPRQRESIQWLKTEKQFFDKVECPKENIVYYDLRIDNKCNLACISCNPRESSLWAKELKINQEPKKYHLDYNKILNAKKIYIAGGEPLIIDNYLDLIDKIANVNPNIELVINTNLTNLPEKTLDSLKKIKKVNLTISIDCFGKPNEYRRYPLKWSKFIDNLERIQELKFSIRFNSVVDAVSIFGVQNFSMLHNINNLIEWNLDILEKPFPLLLSNIPKNLKEFALENAISLKKIKFYNLDFLFRTRVDGIINEIKKDGDPELLANYIAAIDQRRKINHEDYLGVKLT